VGAVNAIDRLQSSEATLVLRLRIAAIPIAEQWRRRYETEATEGRENVDADRQDVVILHVDRRSR
jgi:hypothetical protein